MKRKYLVDKKLSLVLFAVVFLTYSLVYMTKNCYSAAMAAIVAEGIMTKSQTGLISAAFYIVYAPFQIIGGFAADKYPPHRLILIGTMSAGIANLLIYFFTQSYVAMLIIWSLNALAQFGIWPSIFKIVSNELAQTHAPFAIFYIGLASITGLLLSYVIAVFVKNWENNFLISAIALFVITVVFFVSYNRIEKQMVVEEVKPKVEPNPAPREKKKGEFLKIFIKSGVPFMCVVYIIHAMLNIGIKTVAPVMLMESYENISPSLANALNIILVLGGVAGIFVASIGILRRPSPPIVMLGFMSLGLPFLILVSKVGEVHVSLVVISMAAIMVIMASASTGFLRMSRAFLPYGCVGTISGILNCMASLGIVLSNFLFTKFSEDYGWGFTTRFWIYINVAAIVLCLVTIPIWKKFVKNAK